MANLPLQRFLQTGRGGLVSVPKWGWSVADLFPKFGPVTRFTASEAQVVKKGAPTHGWPLSELEAVLQVSASSPMSKFPTIYNFFLGSEGVIPHALPWDREAQEQALAAGLPILVYPDIVSKRELVAAAPFLA